MGISTFDELADLIEHIASNEALALGTLRSDLPDIVTIATKAKLNGGPAGAISRTAANIVYRPGAPALALIDYDAKGMSPAVTARLAMLQRPALLVRRHSGSQ